MFSVAMPLLRDTFTASVAKPPVETAPATISPMVEMQNGHIVFPSWMASVNRWAISIGVTSGSRRFLQSGSRSFEFSLEQELSHGRIFGQADCPVVSV